jgi:hypothetical protein
MNTGVPFLEYGTVWNTDKALSPLLSLQPGKFV